MKISLCRLRERAAAPIAAAIGLAIAVAPAAAVEKTLANDGFTGLGDLVCVPGFAIDEIGAARFTAAPGDYPFTIERVQMLLCPDGPPVDLVLKVWHDDGVAVEPGALLWEEFVNFTPSSSFLNEVDLSFANLTVQSGSIRVGVEFFFAGSPPGLARDLDGITPQVNFVYAVPPAAWLYSEQLGVTGDWIVRVAVTLRAGAATLRCSFCST